MLLTFLAKPSRGDGLLRAIKIRSTPSFGGEVKPEAPRRKILRHINKNTSEGQILTPFAHSSTLLPDYSAGRIARALVDESGVSFCPVHSTVVLHSHIPPEG
jgi:hypothetical protein